MASNIEKYAYIRTFGCQMNDHDSAKMRLLLAPLGYSFVDEPDEADLLIFNTCTIREKAYHKAISEIGRSKFFKRKKKGTVPIIAVCGCVAQQEGKALAERFAHVDIVFGPDQINELPRLLMDLSKPAMALDLVNDLEDYNFIDEVPDRVESGHAFVTVTKGCNCSCSYCIVPSVRGREVCRAPEDVVTEVGRLVHAGVKEVTLLGQNVTSYRHGGETLASLIRRLSNETDIMRVRFTSPNPKDVTEELIKEYATNNKLCPHLHLPAQSGSNAMLKKMRRGYTRERYLEIVNSLRLARNGISITSDFIAGFCGETDDEFEDTVSLLKEVRYDSIFAFKYSPRPGTKAAKELADDVPKAVKEKRLDRILSLQRKITRAKNESLVESAGEVLVTGPDRKESGRYMGRLPDNRIVNFAGNDSMVGAILRVRLIRALANSMEGEVI